MWIYIQFYLMSIRICSFAFLYKSSVYKLISPFECKPEHSYSSILATSQFLVKNFPEIAPPLDEEQIKQIKNNTKEYYNPMIQFWNDYLTGCTVQQYAIRYENVFFILIPLDHLPTLQTSHLSLVSQIQYPKQWNLLLRNREKVAHVFSIPFEKVNLSTRIGIYQTHPITKSPYYPRVNMSAIFIGTLFNNQKWQIFDIPKGQIPQIQDISTFDAIIITGSYYSVLDQTPQIALSLQRLMSVYSHSNKLKIVGICYGHQLICHYFGANVIKIDLHSQLETSISLDPKIVQKYELLRLLQNNLTLTISQLHQDNVENVPQNLQHLGWSQSCKVQATVSKDSRILTSQFHSQLLYNYCESMELLLQKFGDTLPFKIEENQQTIERNINNSVLFLEVISKFIDS